MKWLVLALVVLLSSCTTWPHPAPHTATAPRRWQKYYHHEQRKNERQRRHLVKANITWSRL